MMPRYSRQLRAARLLRATRLLTACAALLVFCFSALAQENQQSQYDRGTPPQHAAGVSAIGSYLSADIGTVNLSNGSLNFALPLGSVGGRGFWLPLTFNYSSKLWSARRGDVADPDGPAGSRLPAVWGQFSDDGTDIAYYVAAGWSIGAAPYLKARGVGIEPVSQHNGCTDFRKVIVKLTLVLPDKGEIQLRDDAKDGAPSTAQAFGPFGCKVQDIGRGRRWHASDGSAIIFINDNPDGVVNGDLAGVVITSDGTRYHFINGSGGGNPAGSASLNNVARCDWVEDRNGNRVSIAYPDGTHVVYTDQLGRTTTVQWDDPAGVRLRDPDDPNVFLAVLVTVPAAGGGMPHYYKIKTDVMNRRYRQSPNPINPILPVFNGPSEQTVVGTALFFGGTDAGLAWIDGEPVVSELILPDRRSLKFSYNEFGEVAEVEMPTGGKVQYDYQAALTLPVGNSLGAETIAPRGGNVSAIDRAVVARRTYPDGVTEEGRWSYAYNTGYTEVICQSGGTTLLVERHYFMPAQRFVMAVTGGGVDGTGYSLWSTGLEKRSEMRSGTGTGSTVLTATEQDWVQRAKVIWNGTVSDEQIANDNRVVETRKVVDQSTARVVIGYDQFNNPTLVEEYDFDGSLKRKTTTSYKVGSPYNTLTTSSRNMVRLPVVQSVFDGPTGTLKASTTNEYDIYAADGDHLPLEKYSTDFPSITGHNTAYDENSQFRGNVTKVTRMVTAGSSVSSFTRYDVLGNVVSVKDARGFESAISYKDDFGNGSNPGLNAGGHTTYSLPTKITSPPPNSGEAQHIAYSQYDFSTGLLTGFKDRNGVITQTTYNDPFDRPTLIVAALATSVEAHTRIYYAGLNPLTVFGVTLTNNDVLTAKDQDAIDDGNLRSWTKTDGFGRTTESRTADPQGDVKVATTYDGLGRAKRVTNPHRSTSGPTYGFTDTTYDLAGRVKTVTTSDGAAVKTDYDGPRVLVTDQALKQRISKADGLGRLTDVWEITPSDSATEAVMFPSHPEVAAGYRTKYSYDALDNLVEVKQQVGTAGTTQTRSFIYDGLKRLTSATNPESGNVLYSYDENSNLRTKTDARTPAVTTTYNYDALNRLKAKTYSDSTPAVTYGYEKDQGGTAVTNAVGRMTFVSTSVSTTSYTQFDPLGRVLQSKQATQAGAVQSYTLSYEYNRAGQMTLETYPSLKKVVTSYDAAGRISEVKDQALNKVYASGFSYAAHGTVEAMTLGNNLIERTTYNTRLQPTQIKLGTSSLPASVLQLDYTYGVRANNVLDVTKNNGNVERQTITCPGLNAQQSYTYDSLNRLKMMSELGGWSQTYSYDRFGNRWVSAGNVPSPQQTPQTQTSFDAATNRINSSVMTGFSYDSVGNLTSDPTTLANGIAYDPENRQTSYTKSGAGATTYSYDGEGQRVKKVTANPAMITVYVYNVMGRLVAEYNDAQQQPAGGTKYLTADHLGSTRVVTNQNQSVAGRYDYLPFGEEIGAGIGSRTVQMGYAGNDSTRQKFTSKERDMESGLDYFLARYYSSAQGRFLSADPYSAILAKQMSKNMRAAEFSFIGYLGVTQQWNRYSYATNNPLKYVDPNGEKIEIFGNEEERKKSFQRIKDIVGAEAAKLLSVKEENGHYYVNYDHSKAGGLAKFSELAASYEQMIDNDQTVEFHVATTFQFKYSEWWGLSKGVRTKNVRSYGGAATLSPEESLSGNIEIYVHPDAGAVTQEVFGNTFLSATRSNDGKPLDFYNDIVDAHEFGHAYGMLKGYRGDDTNDYAHRMENYVRERRKLPNRRVKE
jgi:RHS repeat-associated protein